MRRVVFCLVCALTVMLVGAGASQAQVPQLINYQGYLTDESGNPITGSRSIQFSLYDAETEGIPLWSETRTVTVLEGLFSVLLGSKTPIPYSVFGDSLAYLELKVGSDPPMEPRKRLVSVGYAFHANNADSLDGKGVSDFVQSGQPNSVSADMILPAIVSSVDGVTNEGGNIDLVAGSNVTITPNDGANTITISAAGGTGGDDLGNHTATQNIKLNGKWLSNDGGNEGINVENDGDVIVSQDIDANNKIEAHGNGYSVGYLGGTDYGAYGKDNGSGNYGYLGSNGVCVFGRHHSSGNHGYLGSSAYGAYGEHTSSGNYGFIGANDRGVYGKHNSSSNYGYLGSSDGGVFGYSSSSSGVYGRSASGYGVRGRSYDGYAGYFDGQVFVTGNFIVAGTKAFVIEHPLDPENKYLYHFCIESNELSNVYSGNAVLDSDGEATVELPGWFEALNRDFRYQLTAVGVPGPNLYIAEEISGNRFRIAGGQPGMKVSWQVTGIRQDAFANAHRVQVEVEKEGDERGKYLHPKEHGVSETLGMDYEEHQRMEEEVQRIEEENRRMEQERERIMKENEGIE